jgi:hypothetical protein
MFLWYSEFEKQGDELISLTFHKLIWFVFLQFLTMTLYSLSN